MSSDSAPTTTSPTPTKRVGVIALLAKKDGMSDADFFKHWHEVHGPLWANLEITKKNILKYEQVPPLRPAVDAAIRAWGGAMPASTYKGVAVVEAESYEKIFEALKSDEWMAVGPADEAKFLDRSKTMFIPGPVFTFIDNNK
ncbi:hypothetical protein C8Q80DRAFT_1115427 [Daedaleopsis nitida]|nr:hypothetical protein C8Q80DRAFT_1115427 [Daedaleopsis nitida]